jgi:hypothetical protein
LCKSSSCKRHDWSWNLELRDKKQIGCWLRFCPKYKEFAWSIQKDLQEYLGNLLKAIDKTRSLQSSLHLPVTKS